MIVVDGKENAVKINQQEFTLKDGIIVNYPPLIEAEA
jgi:hypothetical protein